MIEVGRILCPVDLSTHSEIVVQAAVDLARHFGARVRLLTVVENGFPYADLYQELAHLGSPQPVSDVVQSIGHELAQCAARHSDPEVEIEPVVLVGNPAKRILEEAREIGVDAIVVGRIGRSRMEVAVLGSVVQKVVQFAPCHVLTVNLPKPAATASLDAGTPVPR